MTTRADRRGVLRRAVLTRQAQPFSLDRYTVAQLPAASVWTGAQVHVSDETGGAITCYSDGVNWRRISDRAIVSAAVPTALSGAGATSGNLDAVIGPYLKSTARAVGTLRGASRAAAALSASGATAGALQTPPRVPTDLDADAVAVGTMRTATRVSVALSGIGAATATLYGAAA